MWHILEHNSIQKTCRKLPVQVLKKYELWKDIVFRHGPDKLKENFLTLFENLLKQKPSSSKGVYLRRVAIAPTMGPGLKLDPGKLENLVRAI